MTSISAKLKRFFAPMDMTEGNSLRQIIRFSIPLLIGNFAQQMYSTVDAIVVGNYIGDNALGAVGLSSDHDAHFRAVYRPGHRRGITVSQYFGAKNRAMLNTAAGTIVMLALWRAWRARAGVAITRPLLVLLGTRRQCWIWRSCTCRFTLREFVGDLLQHPVRHAARPGRQRNPR
jgi:Na+-driven multidrug efflux pump